ncbi:DNA polymerase delta subunit 4 isoform X1 [Nerophis ophidion]|uniref:DNA polymerase delta subunit 4 isoform X1 n=2 Tax=Nerophis ophidion TaxID=159077 RepID=UPI002AE03FC4|nr:DNA polymerase delta subunit 4 isoform X1 [Nerophis ophidion]
MFKILSYRTSVIMTTKSGLITDSFKVVKKARRVTKKDKGPIAPSSQDTVTETCQQEEQQKLQQFDLDWRFGPSTGISRLQRWERAKVHGLDPPEEIRDLLIQNQTDPEYNLSLWREYPL